MSFEGYFQLLCSKGHYFTADAYMYDFGDDVHCPFCTGDPVWENLVDTTNGDEEEVHLIPVHVEFAACLHCAGTGRNKLTIYDIPVEGRIKC